jgi:PIN domain nuclease of toxin-antitoxin system
MRAIVADTHAAVWYLTNSPRLSSAAAKALDEASAAGDPILIAGAALVSRDGKIRASQVQTIW